MARKCLSENVRRGRIFKMGLENMLYGAKKLFTHNPVSYALVGTYLPTEFQERKAEREGKNKKFFYLWSLGAAATTISARYFFGGVAENLSIPKVGIGLNRWADFALYTGVLRACIALGTRRPSADLLIEIPYLLFGKLPKKAIKIIKRDNLQERAEKAA